MNKVKIFTILVMVFFIVSSCGKKDNKSGEVARKQEELNTLKKEQAKLNQKIKTLEDEMAVLQPEMTSNGGYKVAVEALKYMPFTHFIEIQGKLDGDENLAISALAQGNVKTLLVKVGDRVTKGQILARIDDEILMRNLKDLETMLGFATEIYEKQKKLWDQKIGTEIQFLKAKNDKESLENKISTLKEQIDLTVITSPINGAIEECNLKIGQVPDPRLPAFRVIGFSKLKVVAEIAEAYSSKVNPDDEVIVFFPDINREIKASVTFASKYINPVNRTFMVEAILNMEPSSLKVNMVARIKIRDYYQSKALSVPINLIQNEQSGSFVYVARKENNQLVARRIAIQTGQIYNGVAEILSGLKEGDELVSAGYQSLEEGQAIKF